MRQYILRRVGLALLALWALATVIFALVELGAAMLLWLRCPATPHPRKLNGCVKSWD